MAQVTFRVPDALLAELAAALWPEGKPTANGAPVGDGVAVKQWVVARVRDAITAARYRNKLEVALGEKRTQEATAELRFRAAEEAARAATHADLGGLD